MRKRSLIAVLLLATAVPTAAAAGQREPVASLAADPAGLGRCLAELAESGLAFDPDPELPADDACDLGGAVEVAAGAAVALNRPFLATCDLALAFARFERGVLRPAAERHLGQGVARVEHSGAYRCSYVAGGEGRVSQHATANALDIHAFVLDDGEAVSVLDHWDDPGPAGAFLREVARGACGVFASVLDPNYNEAHRDHLHLDLGPYAICASAGPS